MGPRAWPGARLTSRRSTAKSRGHDHRRLHDPFRFPGRSSGGRGRRAIRVLSSLTFQSRPTAPALAGGGFFVPPSAAPPQTLNRFPRLHACLPRSTTRGQPDAASCRAGHGRRLAASAARRSSSRCRSSPVNSARCSWAWPIPIMVGRLGVVPLGAATFGQHRPRRALVSSASGCSLPSPSGCRRPAARTARTKRRKRCGTAPGSRSASASCVVAGSPLGLPCFGFLGNPRKSSPRAPDYLLTCAVSLIPALLSMAWKSHADALNHPWRPFWIMLGGVGLNIFLNWLWIWGHWGFPALGLEGAGYATLAARVVSAVVMFQWLTRSTSRPRLDATALVCALPARGFSHICSPSDFPTSLQLLTEVGAFAAAALLIGTLGAVPLAAHQVAITCAATTFMVPLGVAMAITVRVGEIVGAGERRACIACSLGGWLYAMGSWRSPRSPSFLRSRDCRPIRERHARSSKSRRACSSWPRSSNSSMASRSSR